MDKRASLRSKLLKRILFMMKHRGKLSKSMETGIDKWGRDKPSNIFLREIEMYVQDFEGKSITVLKKKNGSDDTLIFLYGGAYVCRTTAYHWDFITDFTRRTGATVYCVDYPLLPEFHSGEAYGL